jgi:hypothetical protein
MVSSGVDFVEPFTFELSLIRTLLCARRERPNGRRSAEHCDQLAWPHIGSQAREPALYPLKQVF